jgi:hypothetical protein
MSDEKNQAISPLSLRQQHPELADFFLLSALQTLISQSPNLGLRFGVEHYAQARLAVWNRFRMRMDRMMSDPTEAFILGGECSYRYLRLVELTGRNIGASPDFLQRDMLDGHSILLADLEHSMTDDEFDQEGERYRIIGQTVSSWLGQRRCMKFISRENPDSAVLAQLVITQVITEKMMEELDFSIMEVMS